MIISLVKRLFDAIYIVAVVISVYYLLVLFGF